MYARGLARTLGYQARLFLVSQKGDDRAGLLVFSRQRGPFQVALVPPLTPFTSMLTTTRELGATTAEALVPYRLLLARLESVYDRLLLHHHPMLQDVRFFRWNHWDVTPLYTFHIDLAQEDDLTARWSTGTRRTFRKHADQYDVTENASAADRVIHLARHSYDRHGRPFPVQADHLTHFLDYLLHHDALRIFTATPSGGEAPTAALAVLHDTRTAYYWLAGSVPGPAMTVLIGHVLPVLQAQGIRLFDFVGANTQHIAEFKRRFGPSLAPYYATSRSSNRILSTLSALKKAWPTPRIF